jgi:hypothetical protein
VGESKALAAHVSYQEAGLRGFSEDFAPRALAHSLSRSHGLALRGVLRVEGVDVGGEVLLDDRAPELE